MRVTRIDSCGRPVYGDDSVAVSKGFVSVASTANTTSVDAVTVTNANGENCVNIPEVDTPSGFAVEIEFCAVDPAILALMTGQEVRLSADGSEIVGFTLNSKVDLINQGVALEVWAGVVGDDLACADPASSGLPSVGYMLWPKLKGGYLSDFTVAQGAIDFTLTGAATQDGTYWGVGPYDVVLDADGDPGPLNKELDPYDFFVHEFTTVQPPAFYDGLRPLMDPTAAVLTAVTPTTTSGSLEVAFTVTPNDVTLPVYYDFGDGTWDYIDAAALGDTSHTYAKAGTYTVKATTNGTWVSHTVTVPGA
jgi:hypothetical protein